MKPFFMKHILLVISLIAGNFIFAQKFKISYLSGQEEPSVYSVVHRGEMFSLSLDYQKGMTNFNHAITIKKYGKDLGTVKSFQLSGGEKMYGPVRPLLKTYNDKLYLLYYKEQEGGKIQLLSSEVNTESLQLSEPVELQNIQPNERNLGYYSRNVNLDNENRILHISFYREGPKGVYKTFFFELSPDSSKALLVWSTGFDNKVFYSILDKNMKKIKSGEQELSTVKSVALGSACIDNSGNIYFIYHYSIKRQRITELLAIGNAGKTNIKEITIPECEVSATFARVKQGGNTLFLTGTYKQNSKNLSGVFKQQFNLATSKFTDAEKTVFPQDLVEILDDEEWGSKKKNYGLSEGWFVEPFVLEDGTLTLVGEFRGTISTEKSSYKLSGTILIARFNNNGAVFSRIPKLRVSAGTTYGDSYRIFEFKNKMVFFYSDHASNLQLEMARRPRRSDNYSNSVFVAATIYETGGVKREIIADLSKEDYLAENQSMQPLSPSSYYFPFRKIKKLGGITNDLKWAIVSID